MNKLSFFFLSINEFYSMFEFNGTITTNVLGILPQLTRSNCIGFWASSNNPANCPPNCKWGSYLAFKCDGKVTIIYIDNTTIACSYAITDQSTSITWKIV